MTRKWPHPSTVLLLAAAMIGPAGAMSTAWGQATVPLPAPTPSAVSAAPLPKSTAPVLPKIKDETDNQPAPEKKSDSGFKMHGHWIIDVKNPDGTVAEHRDFENALLPTGASYILGLMGGYYVPGDYMIIIDSAITGGGGPCSSHGHTACGIARSIATQPAITYCTGIGYQCATGLVSFTTASSVSTTGIVTPGSLTFSGSITASQAGTIGYVETDLSECYNPGSPIPPNTLSTSSVAACVTNTTIGTYIVYPLSSKALGPINVNAGQLIQVMVVITFS